MEGRSNGKTLNLSLLSRYVFINIASEYPSRCSVQKGTRGNECVKGLG